MNTRPLPDSLAAFSTPPATYRPQPFFVWNGEITRARITEVLEQFAANGCGGAFLHPRPGLITEYLSSQWFDLWAFALAECKRLGLECNIYDENSYPSGFAGGHVPARNPLSIATTLSATVHLAPPPAGAAPDGETLGFVTRDPATGHAIPADRAALAKAAPGHPVAACELRPLTPKLWQAGFTYVDLCRPEVTDLFLETTHAAYAARFGADFGGAIRFAFADEPEPASQSGGLPFSRFLLREFRREHGYDLAAELAALCFDTPGSPRVRFDYCATLNRLFTENFARRVHDWCERHNLAFTGHYMEHLWPRPFGIPDAMAALRWMQAPGNDLLGFQFTPTRLHDNLLYFINLKELASVASQFNRHRVLTESCGGGGYEMAPADFKPLEDVLLAFGVNLMNPHLSHQTLAGARKYDWPQTLSDHAPWWPLYKPHADHVARAAFALAQAPEQNRVLVLHPTATGWILARPEGFRFPGEPNDNPLHALRSRFSHLFAVLHENQIDFDLGAETLLASDGAVQPNPPPTSEPLPPAAARASLAIANRRYAAVVVPACMETFHESTLRLLREFAAAGGAILAEGQPPALVNGRPSPAPAALAAEFPNQWTPCADAEALAARLRKLVPPRITGPDGAPLPGGLVWRRGILPDGAVLLFLCNPWDSPLETDITLEGGSLDALDTATGAATAVSTQSNGKTQTTRLTLPPRTHALWLASSSRPAATAPTQPAPAAPAPAPAPVPLEPAGIERLSDNLLMLDYVDFEADGVRRESVNTIHADRANWRAQGFSGNLWNHTIQFRRAFLDLPERTGSGFRVKYRFFLEPAALESVAPTLAAAVERPHLYRILCNGRPLPAHAGQPWFDEETRALPIGGLVRGGANELTLEAERFHPLHEIMPVYITGAFSLRARDAGFALDAPAALTPGDWTTQGLPFYPGAVRYRFRVHLGVPALGLTLALTQWRGAAARAALDGQGPVPLVHPPFACRLPGPVPAGGHELAVDIFGNFKNMMGPHFCDGLPGSWSWDQCPSALPPGGRYRFLPSGLFAPPEVCPL